MLFRIAYESSIRQPNSITSVCNCDKWFIFDKKSHEVKHGLLKLIVLFWFKFCLSFHESFHSSTSVLVYCFLMTWHSPKYKHIFPIMPNCKHSLSNTPKHVIMHTRHSKHQDAPKQMFNNKVTRTRALKTTMKQQRTQHIWIHHALAMQLGSRFTLRLYKLDRPPTVADRPPTARTCPISDFWSNFVCFVFKTHWWNF